MSYPTFPPPYGTYQGATAYANHMGIANYQAGHYPTQYPISSPTIPVYQPATQQPRSSPPPDLPPPPPDLTSITPKVASHVVQRLISFELREAGFDAAQPLAAQRLESEVVSLVERLYERAHEYANLASRAGPIATDLMLACDDFKLQTKEMRGIHKTSKARKRATAFDPSSLIPAPPRSPSPELLSSDDEGVAPVVPATLRTLPSYFPDLPPKHTYLKTPVSPPKKAALPSLAKKLKTAGLVQDSLRNLMIATEDSSGQEDAELLGHIVNWEAGLHPRKRWKIGSL